jgi:plasmid stabilization system protein ParE
MPIDKYIVFYKVDEERRYVKISHIIHSARDIEKVLGEAEQAEQIEKQEQ